MYEFAKLQPLNSKISNIFWTSTKLFLKILTLGITEWIKRVLSEMLMWKTHDHINEGNLQISKQFFSIKFLWFAKQLNTSPKYVMLFTCCKRCIWNFWVYIWQPACSCWRSQFELETCEQDCAHMCCYVALQGLLWKDDKFVTRNKFII